MSNIARKTPADLKPSGFGLSAEVLEWQSELRVIWEAVGLSMGQFACLYGNIDKGTISRYLNGQRVPRERWFLDKLLTIQADKGQPVTPAVRDHLTELHLRALQTAHPHEYRVRLINDQLELALTGKLEAGRYARVLEEQLADRNRQVSELAEDKGRLQAAWDADYERLTREIDEITGQLHLARERSGQAEWRCQQLEDLLDHLSATRETSAPAPSVRTLILGLDRDGRIVQHDHIALQILDREHTDLLGVHLSDLTADNAPTDRAAAVSRLLEAIWSEHEDSAILTISTRDGSAEAVVTVHPMRAAGTSLTAQALLRIPVPNAERFVDPRLMRQSMLDDTFTRIGTLDTHTDPLARELMDALVPHFCNAADMLMLGSLAGDDKLPAHELEGSAPVRRIALLHERKDPAWDVAFPTGEILRYPAGSPYYQCMDSATPVLEITISEVQAAKIASAWRREPVARLLSGTSMLMLPLIARGTMLGFFACTRQEGFRRFDAYDVEIGKDFAGRAAVIIDNRWFKGGSIARDNA